MPRLNGTVQLTKAWRHKGESGKIHYIVTTHDGADRHLSAAESGLCNLVDAALLAHGYDGPKSAEEH